MVAFTLEPQYLYKLASMPRGFTSKHSVGNRCNIPSYTITVDFLGNCLLCDCDGWLPLPIGKVDDFQTIDDLFASEQARHVRNDVEQGNFSWCAVDHCGIRDSDKIRTSLTLTINIDESCNLNCPSCRRDPIMITQGPEYEAKLQSIERILQWLELYDKKIHIVMSGNGDPLASAVMRPLIKNFVLKSSQTFTIFTNGLLIRKQLDGLPILNQVSDFRISVDAGSAEVYENVRRPGKWNVLMDNFDYIKHIGKQSITMLNFAFQNKNYRDLPNFIDLCDRYGFKGLVHQLDDWGTWSQNQPEIKDAWTIKNGFFSDHDVLDKNHPNHVAAANLIQNYLQHPKINFSHNLLDKIKD